MYLNSPRAYPLENGFVHDFFWVHACKKSDVKSEANVAVKKVEHSGSSFPIITNTKELEEGDELVMHQPKRKVETVVAPTNETEDRKPKKMKKS